VAGKEAVLQERMLRLSSIMERHGAKSSVFKVVAGDGAGRFDLMNWYDTVEAGATAFEAFGADEDFQKVMHLRAVDPVGEVVGPWIGRMIFGNAPKGSKPVVVHRDYHTPRSAVQKALELAPELQNLMESLGVEVGVGMPIMKDDHEMLRIVYRFDSMVHWGQSVDKMVTDERFLGIVNAAHEAATLKSSRMLVKVE
jgi:hypothetical protein